MAGAGAGEEGARRRPTWLLALLAVLALAGIAGLVALGTWQLERRAWKLDLIARVDARLAAAPVAAPGPADWANISAADDEYRRVTVRGRFLNDRETLVQAVTDLGGGFWVIAPLVTDAGFTVLVNRGFVPPERTDPADREAAPPDGDVEVSGLLRLSEPGGGFLRANDPGAERWHSRDVEAIAVARELSDGSPAVAPYFIDAAASPDAGWPVGGLTVVRFANNHLVYALTWYGLAAMLAGAAVFVARDEMRRRQHDG